jgi:AraC-like DNA-binding protein
LDVLALSSPPQEHARFHRPAALPGVEALHATFIHHRYPAHVHDYWVIARVDCGAAAFELDGRWHTAAAGSTFIIPPGAAHTGESATDRGYSYRVLYLDWPAYADGAGPPQAEDSLLGSPISHDRRCAQSLDQLHQAIIQPGRALEQGEALAAVSHALRDAIRPSAGRLGRGRHPAVARAEAFIHERWWENFTLHELAAAADVSPFHLVRLFHRNIGMPPSAYRRALRVQAAQKLLRRGEPAGGVALTCGFYDQAHLARHFKAVTGVTPSHYAHAG